MIPGLNTLDPRSVIGICILYVKYNNSSSPNFQLHPLFFFYFFFIEYFDLIIRFEKKIEHLLLIGIEKKNLLLFSLKSDDSTRRLPEKRINKLLERQIQTRESVIRYSRFHIMTRGGN